MGRETALRGALNSARAGKWGRQEEKKKNLDINVWVTVTITEAEIDYKNDCRD
jgi:hypothetical protein